MRVQSKTAGGATRALLPLLAGLAPALAHASCAWSYPRDLPLLETHARFWRLDVDLAPGERLELSGRFPYARQMSFNVYRRAGNEALAGIADAAIQPDEGSVNPYRPGAARDADTRSYRVVFATGPAAAGANLVLLPQAPDAHKLRMLYRIYLPDRAHPGGGVPLPMLWRVGADGARVSLTNDCPDPAGVDPAQPLGPTRVPPGDASARSPIEWRGVRPAGSASGDAMISRDNAYAFARTDFRLGEVLVLRGRAPTSPPTFNGQRQLATGQVRYWSLCSYRFPPDRSAACVADEFVPLDTGRHYMVIVAPAARRPADSALRCGAVWLDAMTEGEGALILRHVAPDPAFAESPANIGAGASASAVLGPYEPAGRYMALAEAERAACTAPKRE